MSRWRANRIICGDNVTVMSGMPAGTVDLTVTSPPYDDIRTYGGTGSPPDWDCRRVAGALHRITRPGGHAVWGVADQTKNGDMSGSSFAHVAAFRQAGWKLHNVLIYVKSKNAVGMQATGEYYNNWEYMFLFTKPGSPQTYNAIADIPRPAGTREGRPVGDAGLHEVRKKYRARDGTKRVRHVLVSGYDPDYVRRGRVWRYATTPHTDDPDASRHPARFPDRLAYDCIASWSNPGDIVLDPFAGSGTTCKMARRLKRRYVGIDVDAGYCNLARSRVGRVR